MGYLSIKKKNVHVFVQSSVSDAHTEETEGIENSTLVVDDGSTLPEQNVELFAPSSFIVRWFSTCTFPHSDPAALPVFVNEHDPTPCPFIRQECSILL